MNTLLVMLALSSGILDCEVTAVDVEAVTLACEDGTTLDIPLSAWTDFINWPEPVEGLELKATRDADGLRSVADCETRMREAIDAYCGDGCNCSPPINSLTPEDCH